MESWLEACLMQPRQKKRENRDLLERKMTELAEKDTPPPPSGVLPRSDPFTPPAGLIPTKDGNVRVHPGIPRRRRKEQPEKSFLQLLFAPCAGAPREDYNAQAHASYRRMNPYGTGHRMPAEYDRERDGHSRPRNAHTPSRNQNQRRQSGSCPQQ
eukprot:Platyproteum_vivax@DN14628_c0_g1_i1.p1